MTQIKYFLNFNIFVYKFEIFNIFKSNIISVKLVEIVGISSTIEVVNKIFERIV
jgi:hypothetical protein